MLLLLHPARSGHRTALLARLGALLLAGALEQHIRVEFGADELLLLEQERRVVCERGGRRGRGVTGFVVLGVVLTGQICGRGDQILVVDLQAQTVQVVV